MILSMSAQTVYFLSIVAMGFGIGFLYDIFRILRRIIRHPDFLTQIEDVVFWVATAILAFRFILIRNVGEVRFFAIVGLLLGMVLYFFTISRLVIKVSVTIIEFIKKVLFITVRILLTPVRLLVRLLAAPINRLRAGLRSLSNSIKKILQKLGRCVKMKGADIRREMLIIRKKV